MKKKIAILHIATGRYTVFWKDFYETFQKYFLSGHDRTFFLFTDDKQIETAENVVKIQQENLGWPYITLLRFDIFLSIEEQLKEYDYIFFFNANMLAIVPVGTEVLPTDQQELTVAMHPTFSLLPRVKWSYDRNPRSRAYIPFDRGECYVQGAFIGGTREGFLRMCHILSENIQDDLKRDVIALWHDESHLNHYILDKNPLVLHPGYVAVEGHSTPFDVKIVYLEKGHARYGGHDYMRGLSDGAPKAVRNFRDSLQDYFRYVFLRKRPLAEALSKIFLHDNFPQVVDLNGDLGTQMFQYAFGQAMIRRGKSVIFYDSSGLGLSSGYLVNSGGGGKSPLCCLRAKITWARVNRFSRMLFGWPLKFLRETVRKSARYFWHFGDLRDMGYIRLLADLPGRIWYRGYFRNERYFQHLRAQLCQDFILKNKLSKRDEALNQQILSCYSVAVYLPDLKEMTPEIRNYYVRAIGYIQRYTTNPHFFVFGAREDILNLNSEAYTFVPVRKNSREAVHLQLLRHCRHHIVTQSALSWWGAWLADHEEKIVIAPQKWPFHDESVNHVSLPAKWIIL